MMNALLCCCGTVATGYPVAVLIRAHLGLIVAEGAWGHIGNPTLDTSGDPPCGFDPPALECELSCSHVESIPDYTQIACPGGGSLDGARRWGSSTVVSYKGREWYFRDDPLTLAFDEGTDPTESADLILRLIPPGGVTSVIIGTGAGVCDLRQYNDEPTQLVPTDIGGDCIAQLEGVSTSVLEPVTATWRSRKRWQAPPVVMILKAPAAGWTIAIASSTITVVDAGSTTHTLGLGGNDWDDLATWLAGLGVIVKDPGGGAWGSEGVSPFPADKAGDLPTTVLPHGTADPLPLTYGNVGDIVFMAGDDDQTCEPTWTISIRDDVGSLKVEYVLGWHSYTGTEADFIWGFSADYAHGDYLATVGASLEEWGYGSGFGNVLPIPGQDYIGATLVFRPAATGTTKVCWTNNPDSSVAWDQGPGNCWAACVASASRSIEGGLAQWTLSGVA